MTPNVTYWETLSTMEVRLKLLIMDAVLSTLQFAAIGMLQKNLFTACF